MRRPFIISIGILVMGCWLQAVSAAEPDLAACLSPAIQEPALTGDELERWLTETGARLEKAAHTVAPEDASEMLAVLDIAGFESPGLRAWVADNTGYIPYSGVLRGARGVLIERRGNSLDRALLLAELIAATGSDVRLAQGPAMLIESRPVVRPKADDRVLGVDLLPSDQRPAAQAALARRADCDAATRSRIDQQTATLLALVGEPAAQGLATTEDAYWWVQVKDGDHWSDLFLDELQGLEPTATATHAPDQLPADLAHRVTFRFVAEVWNGRRAVRQTLLEHRSPAADLVGRDIHLGQRPEPTPALNAAVAASDTAALFMALDTASVWVPTISVDGKSHTDRAVSLDGRIAKADRAGLASLGSEPATGAAALGGTGGGLLSGAFGSGGRGGPRGGQGAGPQPALLAEWLEIAISAPGGKTRTQRRTLLDTLAGLRPERGQPGADLVGKAKLDGCGLALLTDIQAGMIGFDPSFAYLAREAAKVAASAVAAAVAVVAGDEVKPEHSRQLPFLAFANARMRMGGDQVYADRANLVLLRTSLRRGADGKLRLLRNADIVDNQVASRVVKPMTGRANGGGDSAFRARLRQGVADTVLETRLLGDAGPSAVNAANLMAQPDRQWRRIKPGEQGQLAQLTLASGLHRQMADDLEHGYVLAVPDLIHEVPVYWRIDPRSGATLGIGAEGSGAAMAERAITGKELFAIGKILADFGFFLGCIAAYEADALDKGGEMAACLTAATLFAIGGPIISSALAEQASGLYLAGLITQNSGLAVLTWLGVTNYTLRNWLKGLVGL